MNKLVRKVEDYINKYGMLDEVTHVVVGVSGGADSVCLLSVLNELSDEYNIRLCAVHVNHMIRGLEADRDEEYVRSLCDKLGIEFKLVKKPVEQIAKAMKLTVEEAGRNVRYEAFSHACESICRDKAVIAVAHNKNDVAETVILNMLRGTGIDGLKGIPPVRDNIIRPLLCAGRNEIEGYLQEKGLSYCIDSTNNTTDYTRNRIRHDILPAMQEINDRAIEHIVKVAGFADELAKYTNSIANDIIENNVEVAAISEATCKASDEASDEASKTECARLSIPISVLKDQEELISRIVIKELIARVCGGRKDIGSSHIDEVRKLYEASSGSYIMLPHGSLAKNLYGKLVFEKTLSIENGCGVNNDAALVDVEISLLEEGEYIIDDRKSKLVVCIYDRPEIIDLSKKEYTKLFDYDKIRNNMHLRTCKDDDFIIINSEGGRKKLGRLFSSMKLNQEDRKKALVIADGDEIMWAVGYRMSERYKVSDATKRIIEIKYIQK